MCMYLPVYVRGPSPARRTPHINNRCPLEAILVAPAEPHESIHGRLNTRRGVQHTLPELGWPGMVPRFFVLGFLLTARARADAALSLDGALPLARAHNRDLSVARAQLQQSATLVEQARAALLPTAVAQGKYTHNYRSIEIDVGQFTNMPGEPIVIQRGE